MNLLHAFHRTSIAIAFLMSVGGAPGLAQSQVVYDDYDTNPHYEYDPYYDYDPYLDDRFGYDYDYGYDYDDYVLTDSELRQRIKLSFAMSPFVDDDDVRISVDHGVVTLSGTVEDRSAMIDAQEIAYDSGAWKVRNKLSQRETDQRPWGDMGDRELKREIEDELWSSPFVNSDNISVGVKNGVATLYGGVENKGEIADAVENAYEAGAKRVKSRLWVDPDLS
jgi:osmotically-inducible protein OsmY